VSVLVRCSGTGNAGGGSATGVGECERTIAILVNLMAHVTHLFHEAEIYASQHQTTILRPYLQHAPHGAIARSNGAKRSSRQNGQAEAIKLICISQNFNDRRARAAHSD